MLLLYVCIWKYVVSWQFFKGFLVCRWMRRKHLWLLLHQRFISSNYLRTFFVSLYTTILSLLFFNDSLLYLYCCVFLIGVLTSMFEPCKKSIMPFLVPKEKIIFYNVLVKNVWKCTRNGRHPCFGGASSESSLCSLCDMAEKYTLHNNLCFGYESVSFNSMAILLALCGQNWITQMAEFKI